MERLILKRHRWRREEEGGILASEVSPPLSIAGEGGAAWTFQPRHGAARAACLPACAPPNPNQPNLVFLLHMKPVWRRRGPRWRCCRSLMDPVAAAAELGCWRVRGCFLHIKEQFRLLGKKNRTKGGRSGGKKGEMIRPLLGGSGRNQGKEVLGEGFRSRAVWRRWWRRR